MTSKPNETDSQTNIYIEVVNRIYGKTKSMLDWPLYTPCPNREPLTHFPLKGVLGVKGVLVAPRARAKMASILRPFWRARARRAQDPIHPEDPFQGNLLLYKVASPGKTPEKTESGHFIRGSCWRASGV